MSTGSVATGPISTGSVETVVGGAVVGTVWVGPGPGDAGGLVVEGLASAVFGAATFGAAGLDGARLGAEAVLVPMALDDSVSEESASDESVSWLSSPFEHATTHPPPNTARSTVRRRARAVERLEPRLSSGTLGSGSRGAVGVMSTSYARATKLSTSRTPFSVLTMSPDPISSRPPLTAAVSLLRQSQLPTEDLTDEHCEHFFFSGPALAPTGLVGLEIFGDVALLRSLVVSADRRGSGLGEKLLRHAEAHATSQGVRSLYLLTTTAESFFAKRGYAKVARELAPERIKATREFSEICPATSACMTRHL